MNNAPDSVKRLARERLQTSLVVYYDLATDGKASAGDLENMVEQALLVVDEVMHSYPPLATTTTR